MMKTNALTNIICGLTILLSMSVELSAANDGSENVASGTPFADGAGAFGPVFGAWTLTNTSANGSENGFFTGTSTNNGYGGGQGIDTSFHYGGPQGPLTNLAWGIFANNGQTAVAYRPFSGGSLRVGQAFEISLDNGFVSTGGYVGLILRTGNVTTNKNTGARFELLFVGGGTNYRYIDAAGIHDTGLGFTSAGLAARVTLIDVDTYVLRININGDFTTHVYSGTLSGSSGAGIDSFAVYDQNAGTGPAYDLFLNNLLVTTVPLVEITSVEIVGTTNAVISFQSDIGAVHEVQARDSLPSGSWTTMTNNIQGTGGILQIADSLTPAQTNRFYRLKTSY